MNDILQSHSVKIVIQDAVWSRVDGITPAHVKRLYQAFRFKSKGAFFHPKVRQRQWDGHTNFFSDKTRKFLTGLLPEITQALTHLGYKFEIYERDEIPEPIYVDERKIHEDIIPGVKLRDYQVENIYRMNEHSRGVVKAPTGAGKTLIMVSYYKILPKGTPTLILFRNVSLLLQTAQEFVRFGIPEEEVGIVHGKKFNPQRLTLSTAQSLHHLEPILGEIRVLIVDEAHEGVTTNSVVKFLRKMKKCMNRFAFSATPWKKDNKIHDYKLKGHFGAQLGDLKTKDLQDRGILSHANCTFFTMPETDSEEEYNMWYQGAYRKFITENDDFHDMVADLVKHRCQGRTLIIVEHIEHGDRLVERIPGALWVNGADQSKAGFEMRNKVRELLRTGQDVIAISTRIFGTGIDFYLHNLINCAGMASDISTIQRFGRGLRKSQDKDEVTYFDFIHASNKYLERHSKNRIRTLKKEGHQISIEDYL